MVDDTNDKGDSKKNLPASSAEEKTPEGKTEQSVSQDVKNQQKTSDMPEWDSLKGSTQDRVKQLISERNEANRKHEEYLANQAQSSFNQSSDKGEEPEATTADFQQAVDKLKKVGKFVTEDKLQAIQDRNVLDRSHDKLEARYQGSGTLPKYIREEVEDFARKRGLYDMDIAFQTLYHDEFLDDEIAKRSNQDKKTTPYTEKPKTSSASKEQPMTKEYIQKKLGGPRAEAFAFYDKHRDTIEEVIKASSQTE